MSFDVTLWLLQLLNTLAFDSRFSNITWDDWLNLRWFHHSHCQLWALLSGRCAGSKVPRSKAKSFSLAPGESLALLFVLLPQTLVPKNESAHNWCDSRYFGHSPATDPTVSGVQGSRRMNNISDLNDILGCCMTWSHLSPQMWRFLLRSSFVAGNHAIHLGKRSYSLNRGKQNIRNHSWMIPWPTSQNMNFTRPVNFGSF